VIALLHHATLLQHDDPVGLAHGGEAVRDHQRGAAVAGLI